MALQSVMSSGGKKFAEIVKSSEMQEGDSIKGHLLKIEESRNYEGTYNFILRTHIGDVLVYGSGNMKYAVSDGNLQVGALTEIIAKGKAQKQTKQGKKYTQSTFDILQDPDDVVEVGTLALASTSTESAPTTSSNNSIKAQADRLAKGVAGGAAKRA